MKKLYMLGILGICLLSLTGCRSRLDLGYHFQYQFEGYVDNDPFSEED